MTIKLTPNENLFIKACTFNYLERDYHGDLTMRNHIASKEVLSDIFRKMEERHNWTKDDCKKVLKSLMDKEVLEANFDDDPIYKGAKWHKREDSELIGRLRDILYSVRCSSLSDDQIEEVAECLACSDKTIVDLL